VEEDEVNINIEERLKQSEVLKELLNERDRNNGSKLVVK
jgi:hypothetical protein